MDLAFWHVDDFDILLPQIQQFKNVFQAVLECLEAQRQRRVDLLLPF